MADRNYWVRTEQGRTWGPFTLTALERLRGQLTEKSEASLDGTTWRPGTEFPELRELLAPARKVEKKASLEAPPPRISRAMAEAFGIKEGPLSSGEPAAEKAPDAAPLSPPPPSSRPSPPPPSSRPSPPPPSSRPSPPSSLTPPRAPEPPPVEEKLEVPGSGDLSQLSALRLCALAALTSASGLLVLELEKGSTLRISFRRGTPEHLSTDDLDHSLLRFLQRRGVLPAASALAAEEQAAKTGQEIVSVLFQLQLIPPADAHRLLGEYAIYLLDRALLSWRGKFSFEKDAPSPPGAFPLGSRWTLLAESVRRLELPLLRARLGKRLLRPVVRSGGLAIGKVEELALNAQESRLYASLDGTRTGDELLKSQDPGVTVRLLYLLSELGHLAFAEMPEEALPDLELEPAKPASLPSNAERAPEQKQRQLPKSAREAGRSPPPAAARTSKAAPPVMQSAAKVPQPPATPPPILRPPPVWAAAPPGESPAAALERIAALLEQFAKADHFEVLGVERKTATAAEAKRNFFVLAKELHPDTVTDPSLEDLRNLKEQLFARINAAAQVLSDDKRRKEYEDELAGKKDSVDVARIFAAEESFQRAEIMIKARKYQEGLDLIEIGHMAKVVGDMKLAQKCYQRVLELEPTHIEAQRELRLMGKKG